MIQQPNKYHISDDGIIFRINEDGSFTKVGDVNDVYEVQQLREKIARLNRQLWMSKAQKQAPYEQIDNKVNRKSVVKIVVTSVLLVLFLMVCIMAIIYS
ncbi:MAG: hypothetical protein K2K97_09520 [Muribaculaceae bacterium]|nr:hypothetical protein [Muribaculaceae bacterium]